MAIEDLLKKAVAAFNALSPEQQAEMMEEQRQSWVRGNVGLSRDERGMTSPVMPRPAPADLKARDRKRYKLIRKSLQNKGLLPAATDTGLDYYTPADVMWSLEGIDPVPSKNGQWVKRSQAEELLVAERAENTRLQSENDAQADQISELQMTPWPEWATKVLAVIRKRSGYDGYGDAIEGVDLPAELDECIAAIEADNAALTARVKELEDHCELLCDPTIIRLEKENSDLEARLAAAEKSSRAKLAAVKQMVIDHLKNVEDCFDRNCYETARIKIRELIRWKVKP